MKNLLYCIAAAWILTTANPSLADNIFKAKISGTVQTQIINSPTDLHVPTAPLNKARIFQEFQVSQNDYELVLDFSGGGVLELMPKSAGLLLPITVIELASPTTMIDTKTHKLQVGGPLATGIATNLFENVAGQVAGTISFKGSYVDQVYTKIALTGLARGTDQSGGDGVALLSFKISTQGHFVQQQ